MASSPSSFSFFDNGRRFVGIKFGSKKVHPVVLGTVEPRHYAFSRCYIQNLSGFRASFMVNQELDSALISQKNGNLTQVGLCGLASQGRVLRDYGILEIGFVLSSVRLGHIAILGGNHHYFQLIDMRTRTKLHWPIKTAVKSIMSLELCVFGNGFGDDEFQIILVVAGIKTDYSISKTDIFDLTKFFANQSFGCGMQNPVRLIANGSQ